MSGKYRIIPSKGGLNFAYVFGSEYPIEAGDDGRPFETFSAAETAAIKALRDRSASMTPTAPTIAEQIEWLEAHFEAQDTIWRLRECDRYHAALKSLRSVEALQRDAARFQFLQNLPITDAQAFFWNHVSRRQR